MQQTPQGEAARYKYDIILQKQPALHYVSGKKKHNPNVWKGNTQVISANLLP